MRNLAILAAVATLALAAYPCSAQQGTHRVCTKDQWGNNTAQCWDEP
jgi:hypothetical protein